MSKQKKEAVILSVLIVVLVLVLLLPMRKRTGRAADPDIVDPDVHAAQGADVDQNETTQSERDAFQRQAQLERHYLSHGFPRDPFSLEEPQEAKLVLRLNGVMCSEENRAIINGEVVSEGAQLHGLTVGSIEPEAVILIKGPKRIRLTVDKPLSLSMPNN
jgi:hypothetical protein